MKEETEGEKKKKISMSEPIITTGMECENLCNISIYLYKFQSSAYLKNTDKEMKKKL